MKIKMVGVVGAGVMGVGLAQDLAVSGHRVVLIDVADDILKRARSDLILQLRLHRLLTRDSNLPDSSEVLSQITFETDLQSLRSVDFLIENVTEKWEVKAPLYPRLDSICGPRCVFAANTSCIPIAKLARLTKRAQKVLGIHFMNPVPLKSHVELIRSEYTAADTVDQALDLLKAMNKEATIVNDSPGFVSNRVLMLTINEAIALISENVASAADVDSIFKKCFGHSMGPLETADLIGLDTILQSLVVLRNEFDDAKFEPAALLRAMVSEGALGRKSGRGFYKYPTNLTSIRQNHAG